MHSHCPFPAICAGRQALSTQSTSGTGASRSLKSDPPDPERDQRSKYHHHFEQGRPFLHRTAVVSVGVRCRSWLCRRRSLLFTCFAPWPPAPRAPLTPTASPSARCSSHRRSCASSAPGRLRGRRTGWSTPSGTRPPPPGTAAPRATAATVIHTPMALCSTLTSFVLGRRRTRSAKD